MKKIKHILFIMLILMAAFGISSCNDGSLPDIREASNQHQKLVKEEIKCPTRDTSWKQGKLYCSTHCSEKYFSENNEKITDTAYYRSDTLSIGTTEVVVNKHWISSDSSGTFSLEIEQVFEKNAPTHKVHIRRRPEYRGGF